MTRPLRHGENALRESPCETGRNVQKGGLAFEQSVVQLVEQRGQFGVERLEGLDPALQGSALPLEPVNGRALHLV